MGNHLSSSSQIGDGSYHISNIDIAELATAVLLPEALSRNVVLRSGYG